MGMRKRTLRRLTPEARKLARLTNELESVATRLKNLVATVQDLEMWEKANQKRQASKEEELVTLITDALNEFSTTECDKCSIEVGWYLYHDNQDILTWLRKRGS